MVLQEIVVQSSEFGMRFFFFLNLSVVGGGCFVVV